MKKIEDVVDQLIISDSKINSNDLEVKLNELVFELYNLTDEEISIVMNY